MLLLANKSIAAMLHNVVIVVIEHTPPCSMLLAMLAMRKEMGGVLFLCMHVVLFLYGYDPLLATLWAARVLLLNVPSIV